MEVRVKLILFSLILDKAVGAASGGRTPINPVPRAPINFGRAPVNSGRVPINAGRASTHSGGAVIKSGKISPTKDKKDQSKTVINELIQDITDSNIFSEIVFIGDMSNDDPQPNRTTEETKRVVFSKVFIDIHYLIDHIYENYNSKTESKSCSDSTREDYWGNSRMITGLNRIQEKDNKKTLFLLTPPETLNSVTLNVLVQDIKIFDQSSKIIIIYRIPPRRMNIFLFEGQPDIYTFLPDSLSQDTYTMFKYCKFCVQSYSRRIDGWDSINAWRPRKGFRYPLTFPHSLNSNYFGINILISVDLHPGSLWITGQEEVKLRAKRLSCTNKYGGPMYEDYLMLSRMLNFTLKVQERAVGFMDVDIDWRRVEGKLDILADIENMAAGNIDVVGGGSLAYYAAHQAADISAPTFYQTGANLISVEPLKTFQGYAILQPFAWHVWLLIVSTVFFTGLALYCARNYSGDRLKLIDAMWNVLCVVCWDTIRIRQPSAATMILLSCYMLAITALLNVYFGYYTAFMASPSHIRQPIDTKEQLLESDLAWIGGRMVEYYKNYFDSEITDLEDRFHYLNPKEMKQEVKTATEILIASPDEYAYFEKKGLIEWSICHHNLDLKGRKMYYSKETIGDYMTYMYFKKGSITTEIFNRKILLLHDTGIIKMNQRKFVHNSTHLTCYEEKETEVEIITLKGMKSALYLLLFGYVIALRYFIWEMKNRFKVVFALEYTSGTETFKIF